MSELTHEQLWHLCERKPDDYEPSGKRNRVMVSQIGGDCSGRSKWFHTLSRPASPGLGRLPQSRCHRAGLLRFEHQGMHGIRAGVINTGPLHAQ